MKTTPAFRVLVFLFLFAFVALGCQTSPPEPPAASEGGVLTAGDLVWLRSSLVPFSQAVNAGVRYPAGPSLGRFTAHYSLPPLFALGKTTTADGYDCALFGFEPQVHASRDVDILFVHGYLTNTGIHARILRMLTLAGYRVLSLDLPGHGLSSGDAYNVRDFSEYGNAVEAAVRAGRDSGFFTGKPIVAIGHSTGCSAIIEYATTRKSAFRDHILLAPLVRSAMWDLSQFGTAVLGWAIQRIPAARGRGSHDQAYKAFIKTDTAYEPITIPLAWVRSLARWNVEVKSRFRPDVKFLVIQGDSDVVVDFKYGLPVLQSHFTTDLVMIPGADHELTNERKVITDQVDAQVLAWLERK